MSNVLYHAINHAQRREGGKVPNWTLTFTDGTTITGELTQIAGPSFHLLRSGQGIADDASYYFDVSHIVRAQPNK